jgi:hypothetical protein
MIKKFYDNLEVVNNVDKPDWDHRWNLFQPLEKYSNLYLRYAIKMQRTKLENEKKFWIDGVDDALHDRYPFFFFLENDENHNLIEVLRENAEKKTDDDPVFLTQRLATEDTDAYFRALKEFDAPVNKEIFLEVDEIIKNYRIEADSRIKSVYYDILKLSMILNKRKQPTKQDYDLLRFIIEKTNRQITLTETNDYTIKGPEPEQIETTTKFEEKHFGVMIESEKDVFSDFSTKG